MRKKKGSAQVRSFDFFFSLYKILCRTVIERNTCQRLANGASCACRQAQDGVKVWRSQVHVKIIIGSNIEGRRVFEACEWRFEPNELWNAFQITS